MIVDLRQIEQDTAFKADICIIGAGAAGISIAREFAGSDIQICVLESGGFEIDGETQALCEGVVNGVPYAPLDSARLRFFGGTTNHWTGWCAPFEELDFEPRPGVPHTGWPLSKKDLAPYYRRAAELCQVGPVLDEGQIKQQLGFELPSFDPRQVRACFWQSSPPTLFGEVYRDELAQARNVAVLLYANAVNIQMDESASVVKRVDLRTLDGKSGAAEARYFILACGGIENARLLLLSNSVEPAGLGNRHDLVGRFFQEHANVRSGVVISDNKNQLFELLDIRGDLDASRGHRYRGRLCTGDALQLQEQVLHCTAYVEAEVDATSGVVAAKDIWRSVRGGELPSELDEKLWRVVTDLDDVVAGAYRRFVQGRRTISPVIALSIFAGLEQAPDPDSRVALSAERDALGLNRASLVWRLGERDRRTVEVMMRAIGTELARLKLGRVRLAEWLTTDDRSWPDATASASSAFPMETPDISWHHMGTTRMADDPKRGVVDRHCRVHSTNNLYVAGSSVFPTSGRAAPTINLIALALRLADHLKIKLAATGRLQSEGLSE